MLFVLGNIGSVMNVLNLGTLSYDWDYRDKLNPSEN